MDGAARFTAKVAISTRAWAALTTLSFTNFSPAPAIRSAASTWSGPETSASATPTVDSGLPGTMTVTVEIKKVMVGQSCPSPRKACPTRFPRGMLPGMGRVARAAQDAVEPEIRIRCSVMRPPRSIVGETTHKEMKMRFLSIVWIDEKSASSPASG